MLESIGYLQSGLAIHDIHQHTHIYTQGIDICTAIVGLNKQTLVLAYFHPTLQTEIESGGVLLVLAKIVLHHCNTQFRTAREV